MKLSEIRETKNLEELKPAIKYLALKMQPMAHGTPWEKQIINDNIGFLQAILRNAIESKAKEFGVTYREINELASGYQDERDIEEANDGLTFNIK